MRRCLAGTGSLACIMLGACASVPDVTVNYFLPQAQTAIQVLETVACTTDGTKLYAIQAVTATTTYFADPARAHSFSVHALSHWYADTSATIKLTPDGRLQSINGTTAGAGEGLIKSVIGTLVAVAAIAGPPLDAATKAPTSVREACAIIQTTGAGKPVSLTYNLAKPINYRSFNTDFPLIPDPPSSALLEQIRDFLPVLAFHIGPPPPSSSRTLVYMAGHYDDVVPLRISDTGNVELTLTATVKSHPTMVVFDQLVTTPLQTDYQAPIPRGAFFGSKVAELDFDASGAITVVTYNKIGGSTDAATAIGDVATPLAAKTTAQKAADVQAQADLIGQQQRLMTCRVNPAGCT